MRDLTVSLLQCELAWEAPEQNRQQLAERLRAAPPESDLLVLPEMFTTGFSMRAQFLAEDAAGPTLAWMQALARERDCAVAGSLPVRVEGQVFNRMLFVTPDAHWFYDKRHLFRMAGEHQHYAPGRARVVVPWRGWRINLQVCYDLRFPVFSRSRQDYDLLLYVANWPSARAGHWRTLLRARAIENQACVVGLNRVGSDGNDVAYSGDSLAIDARGEVLADLAHRSVCETVVFSGEELLAYRKAFPSFRDADEFVLSGLRSEGS